MNPVCPYCSADAVLTDSAEVYGGRSYGMIWLCHPCDAYVGVHKNSKDHKPLGRLANAELRKWKIRAHAAFDPKWKNGGMTRKEAYRWLRSQIGVAYPVHIGESDVDRCKKIVELCAT